MLVDLETAALVLFCEVFDRLGAAELATITLDCPETLLAGILIEPGSEIDGKTTGALEAAGAEL